MTVNALLAFAGALISSGLAVYIVFQGIRSVLHWTFAVGMIALALERALIGMSAQAVFAAEVLYWQHLGLVAAALLPGSWLLFSLGFARANCQELVARWRWFAVGSFVLPLALVTLFRHALFAAPPGIDKAPVSSLPLGWSGHLSYLFILCMSLMILINLEGTLRAAAGSKRWHIKFMVLGVGGLFVIRIYTIGQWLLFSAVNIMDELINSCALVVAGVLIIVSFIRGRLLNLDIYLSQTSLYHLIVAVVVAIYLLGVGVLVKALSYFGVGQLLSLGAPLAFLALMGLATALLSEQLRQQMKRLISVNFRRPRYDYRREWTAFTRQTASLMEVEHLCAVVGKLVSETFGVPRVSVWLVDDTQEHFFLGGSTVFSKAEAQGLKLAPAGELDLIRLMQTQQMVLDFDAPLNAKANELREFHASDFREAHIRYAVPLVAGHEFLGCMTLDERLTQEPFSVEDFDLLKTIAGQAASSLLNLTLSERLQQSKELEAFQTLSAFVIHDLKNLAATLSMTLQTLPVHYDNPVFRNDALRAISQSVAKMNGLCSCLSPLSQRIELQRTEVDLNTLVTTTLADLSNHLKASLIQDLHTVPKLVIDPEQMQKVLINLILNAQEAVEDRGEVRVATRQRGGWVVLALSDTGCGMSKAFIEESLFRPFHSTKAQGFGIGLFHSKTIVEAHQGRIEVESKEGKGSTFRVLLPSRKVEGMNRAPGFSEA